MTDIVTVSEDQQKKLISVVSAAVDFAKSIEINTSEDFHYAADALRMVKERRKVAEDLFGPSVKAAYAAHKAVTALKKKATEPLDDATLIVKDKVKDYVAEQQAKCKKAQAEAGDGVLVPLDLPKAEGISFRKKWRVDILDATKLKPEYYAPDLKKIEQIGNALGADAALAMGEPGAVRVYEAVTVVVKS